MIKNLLRCILLFGLIIPTINVVAKGDFDYLLVKGPGITGEIDITDSALTGNFFAFANFAQGNIPAPQQTGEGYQIFRIYVVDGKDQPFDQLHYYPYTGYVFYDGIVNGSSEYDGKWYRADPAAEVPFRAALRTTATLSWVTFAVVAVILGGFYVAYRSKPKNK